MGLPRRRTTLALVLLGVVLLVLPFFVGSYVMSVLVVFLFAAYLGQCWNIMMGFAGQLSLGHALYVGLGSYVSAALFVHFGVLPWLGLLAGVVVAALAGAAIAALSFRFGVTGVYFALLTIAFDEFTRILFDHLDWFGASAGLFLPVTTLTHNDLLHLRGSPEMFYYVLLVLSAAMLALSRLLLNRRIGYYWLAIREDQAAAQSLGINVFRYKLAAVTLSAALTAVAGAVMAFYDNNLYPDTVFTTARSVEIITGPVIGGVGTLFGPILGAFVLTTLGEVMTDVGAMIDVPGMKQWFYGATLVGIVLLQPAGIWPWLRRRLRLGEDER
jgi:branched-chain amino acid transport system permease protein